MTAAEFIRVVSRTFGAVNIVPVSRDRHGSDAEVLMGRIDLGLYDEVSLEQLDELVANLMAATGSEPQVSVATVTEKDPDCPAACCVHTTSHIRIKVDLR